LEKVEQLTEEEMWVRALKEWQRIESVKREARLMMKSGEVTIVKPVLFKEEEDVAK